MDGRVNKGDKQEPKDWGPRDHPPDQDVLRVCNNCEQIRHITWFKAGLPHCLWCEYRSNNFINELSKLQVALRSAELQLALQEEMHRTSPRTTSRN